MAFARDVYTATGGQTDFTISFNYLTQTTDVNVYQNGSLLTLTTDYTFPNSTTMRLGTGATADDVVVLQRGTSQSTRLVDYTTGSLTEADLDTDSLQAFYIAQEAVDIANTALKKDTSEIWDAVSIRIQNVGAPTSAGDAVTKTYADALSVASGNVVTAVDVTDDYKVLTANDGSFTWENPGATSEDAGAAEGPTIDLYRNSASPADADLIGNIPFSGENDAAQKVVYGKIQGRIDDVTDGTEDGGLNFWSMIAGTLTKMGSYAAGWVIGSTQTDQGVGTLSADALYDESDRVRATGLVEQWIPAGAMISRTTNGADSGMAESSTNKVMSRTFNFHPSTAEYVQIQIAFPKSWDEGTIQLQYFWSAASGSGDVIWTGRGMSISDSDVLDTAMGTAVDVTDTLGTAEDIMISSASSAITIAGSPAAGDLCVIEIYRNATLGGDTLAVDARLHGVKLLYSTNAKNDA